MSYSYTLVRDDIITAALRKLGVLAQGQVPTAQNLLDGAQAVNTAIGLLKTKGLPMWARTEYTFTPTTDVYEIGVGKTLNVPYPVKLLQAIRTEGGGRLNMDIEARQDFNILPTNSLGTPLKVNYQAYINYGVLSIWPKPPATNTATITLVYQRPFDYLDSGSDTLDFPEEWQLPLIYQTAVLLAPEWGIPLSDRQAIKAEAAEYLTNVLEGAQEDGSFFIMPHRRI